MSLCPKINLCPLTIYNTVQMIWGLIAGWRARVQFSGGIRKDVTSLRRQVQTNPTHIFNLIFLEIDSKLDAA